MSAQHSAEPNDEPNDEPNSSAFIFALADAAATGELGHRLASVLLPGDLVILEGDLGAGKTTLTQGMGAGLGVRGPITSPTFVVARHHRNLHGGPSLVHVDVYRVGSFGEVDDLDLDDETAVTVVEWGAGVVDHLSDSYLHVLLKVDHGDLGEQRTAVVTGVGQGWERLRSLSL
ncbi:MAG: tRNA (adenosine(37)-N6)-threonylcarbamoyltransferase complex ATPase subunit type 1 TsaE [Actinomycetes bacterium]|jgi:tRNA threonylcarbamoyladenosine biosynthesis protein TsaE|nr:tRNA (adenosine(37)-N6)-threonylcarbamoyltransferase complex ATPase subunit type 1 TsaE [Candidatus Nanopelagicales bacterium]MDP4887255.1 tRNA (adenosine(37)-N6)-threonylcarbamoyltransferase complex ATPase subunit type 1 TsaE [Candidatus Nanopelagicales bacterium]